ncbi:MAG: SDR family NAD(P)-dependent oxidoreductase [Bacteroidota bacterium]
MKLEGKQAVITGGGSGIGAAITKRFANEGADVVIWDVDEKGSRGVVDAIRESGGSASFRLCDVGSMEATRGAADALDRPADILINNAGVSHIGNLEETSEEDLDRLYRINIKGIWTCSRAVIDGMKSTGSGVILNMASIVSHIGIPDRFAYSMTKGAVLTMTYSIAVDYLDDGIRCNCIAPARVHTPFVDDYLARHYPGKEKEMYDQLSKTQPIGRMGQPEEIAGLATYLCSDEAAFITGASYPIDGGFLNLKR